MNGQSLDNSNFNDDDIWAELDQINLGKLEIPQLAKSIANGHAFNKHRFEFAQININTVEQLAQHIDNIMNNPSEIKNLERDRIAYWDDVSRMIVIYDPGDFDYGTAFIPVDGKIAFDRL